MTEHPGGTDGNSGTAPDVEEPMADRRAAHERLSTGALARWTRACATHPWRVVFGWIGIIAAPDRPRRDGRRQLRDEFEIPGSDTQKATDLIESEFASEQGGVLNVVFAAPEGERLDTPERKAAIEKAIALLKSSEFKPTEDKAGLESVGDPFSKDTVSDDGRIAYAEAQFDRDIEDEDRDAVVAVEDAVRETVEPAGVTVRVQRRRRVPADRAGDVGAARPARGDHRAAGRLPHVRRDADPDRAGDRRRVATAFLLLFILAGLTDINTITPILVSMIGLGVGIDYSLFIVTRFRQFLHEGLSPRDAAAEAGASAGRAVLFAGLTVAISVTGLAFFGLDFVTKLGIGSALGVLTTVLIANSLLLAVLRLLGHKVDRLKVPFLRPIDDSEAAREKTLVARWGRFVTAHARVVFPVVLLAGPGARGDVGARPPRRRRPGHAAEGADRPPGLRPARRGLRGRLQRPDPDRRRRERRRRRRRRRSTSGVQGLEGVASVGEPQLNDEKTVAIVFVTPDSAPQDEATDKLVDRLRNDVVPAATRGRRRGRLRLGPDGGVQGHRRSDHGTAAAVPALHHRRHVHRARDGVPLDRDLADGGDHDDPLRLRRLRRAHARGAGGPPARAHRPRQDRPDRDLRATDRVRDPVRALDGLHGLPDEPHPGGARPRPADAGGGRARDRRDRPGGRRRGADHGHGLRGLHPHAPIASRRSSGCCSRSRSSRTR